jgi:hypothetical protein
MRRVDYGSRTPNCKGFIGRERGKEWIAIINGDGNSRRLLDLFSKVDELQVDRSVVFDILHNVRQRLGPRRLYMLIVLLPTPSI